MKATDSRNEMDFSGCKTLVKPACPAARANPGRVQIVYNRSNYFSYEVDHAH